MAVHLMAHAYNFCEYTVGKEAGLLSTAPRHSQVTDSDGEKTGAMVVLHC
jgi:hypothetical protein